MDPDAERLEKIETFKTKLVDVICHDISRVLDITAESIGPQNSGVNLTAMVVVLIAIETIAQFNTDITEIEKFVVRAKDRYSELESSDKELLINRYFPRNVYPPIELMHEYFNAQFSEKILSIDGEEKTLAEVIWKFRNAQAHGYFPFISKNHLVKGRVNWVFENVKNRKGIKTSEIENLVKEDPKQVPIYGISGEKEVNWVSISVQVVFVHFKLGVEKFLEDLKVNDDKYAIFEQNYEKNKELYYF